MALTMNTFDFQFGNKEMDFLNENTPALTLDNAQLTDMETDGLGPIASFELDCLFDDSETGNDFDETTLVSTMESAAQDMFLSMDANLNGIDNFDVLDPLELGRSNSITLIDNAPKEESEEAAAACVIQTAYRAHREHTAAIIIQAAFRTYRERPSDNGATFIGNAMYDSDDDGRLYKNCNVSRGSDADVENDVSETESEADESESDSEDNEQCIPLGKKCNMCSDVFSELTQNGNCTRCEKEIAKRVEKENEKIKKREEKAQRERERRLRIAAAVEKRSLKRSRNAFESGNGFQCHGCDRGFSSKQALKIHIMGYGTRDKPGHGAMDDMNHPLRWRYGDLFIPQDFDHLYNKCTICKHGFLEGGINRKWLKRHYKNKHPGCCVPAPMPQNHFKKQKTNDDFLSNSMRV